MRFSEKIRLAAPSQYLIKHLSNNISITELVFTTSARLGNHLFRIASLLSLKEKHEMETIF